MGVCLRHFFVDRPSRDARDVGSAGGVVGAVDSALLIGPSSSGKTTLLFQYAMNLVAEGFSNVVFLCKRGSMEYDPPSLREGVDTQSLERISIKYVSNDEELDKYFAAFHLANPLPQAVIVDSFSEFFESWIYEDDGGGEGPSQEVAMVDSLALCLDAMELAGREMPSGQIPTLVLSDLSDDAASSMYIYKKYLSRIFAIKRIDSSKFFLSEECKENAGYARYTFTAGGPIQLDELVL